MQKVNICVFESAREFSDVIKKFPDANPGLKDGALMTVYEILVAHGIMPAMQQGCLVGISNEDGIFEMNLDDAFQMADKFLVNEEIAIDRKRKLINGCKKDISCMKCRIDRGFDIFGDLD